MTRGPEQRDRAARSLTDAASSQSCRGAEAPRVEFNLPSALSTVVEQTVAATRLRRAERADIERELRSHLAEGLDAGRTVEALRQSFGEPREVARLLRQAVIARRNVLDRTVMATLRWGGIVIAGLVVIYLAIAIRVAMLHPFIRFDPLDRLVATLPKDEGDPAWPLYREAMGALEPLFARRRTDSGVIVVEGVPPVDALLEHWSWREDGGGSRAASADGQELPSAIDETARAAAEEAVNLLRAHAPALAQLRAAAALPVLGIEPGARMSSTDQAFFGWTDPRGGTTVPEGLFADSAITIQMPYLGTLRLAVRLLKADAMLAAREEDTDRAVDDLVAMLGIANHAEQPPLLINQLVGTAIRAMMTTTAIGLIEHAGERFSNEALARLASAIASIPPNAFVIDLSVERLFFDDVIQRVYTDDGEGGGVIDMDGLRAAFELADPGFLTDGQSGGASTLAQVGAFLLGPAAAAVVADRAVTEAAFDRLICAARQDSELPVWRFENRAERVAEAYATGSNRWRYPLVALFGPAYGKAILQRHWSRTGVDAAALAVALERYRRAHGAWPETLAALVPNDLAQLPLDPYTGTPLHYAVRESGPVVWSVGPDRVNDAARSIDSSMPSGAIPPPMPRWVSPEEAACAVAGTRPASDRVPRGDWILFNANDATEVGGTAPSWTDPGVETPSVSHMAAPG